MTHLILLHGALGSASMFNAWIPSLSSSYKVHALDFPGHGEREMSNEFSLENFAHFLLDYIETNNLEKVSVFGYSMGGYVALYAASIKPQLFERVMTLATKFTWNETIVAKETAMLNPEKMKEKIPSFVKHLMNIHHQLDWKIVVQQTANMLDKLGKNPLLTNEVLTNLSLSVLVGIGDNDAMVTIDETLAAYRVLPNANMYILPYTKHPFEQVDMELLKFNLQKFLH